MCCGCCCCCQRHQTSSSACACNGNTATTATANQRQQLSDGSAARRTSGCCYAKWQQAPTRQLPWASRKIRLTLNDHDGIQGLHVKQDNGEVLFTFHRKQRAGTDPKTVQGKFPPGPAGGNAIWPGAISQTLLILLTSMKSTHVWQTPTAHMSSGDCLSTCT